MRVCENSLFWEDNMKILIMFSESKNLVIWYFQIIDKYVYLNYG